MARGLNYISGLEYTPASLGFLLRERQWRMGEIEKLRKRIAAESGRIARLQRVLADRDGARSGGPRRAIWDSGVQVAAAEARIAELQGDIAALDRVVSMHPHKVDLAKLPPVRKRLPDLLTRGHLERSVINALRSADGRPLATAGIAVAVALEHGADTTPGEATWGACARPASSASTTW